MATVETSKLIGPALDWAVARAVDLPAFPVDHSARGPVVLIAGINGDGVYSPSTDWAQGGPLIDAYRIAFEDGIVDFYACLPGGEGYGKTHLIAACRAIVVAKLGEAVDIPTELVVAS